MRLPPPISLSSHSDFEFQDKTVLIWTQDSPRAPWTSVALKPAQTAALAALNGEGKFGDVVWRVSWSASGNVLAVSSGASPPRRARDH